MPRYPLNPVTTGLSLGLAGALLALGSGRTAAEASPPVISGEVSPQRVEEVGLSQANRLIEYVETNLADRNRPSEGRRDGGASRTGPCAPTTGRPNLTALVPTKRQLAQPQNTLPTAPPPIYQSVLSLTTEAQPVLWFYFPYTHSEIFTLELILQDENGHTLDQTDGVPTAQGPGILSMPVSPEVALVVGERYNWYLNVYCHGEFQTHVEGWLERVDQPERLAHQLTESSLREQAALYAANGIWQDALTIVAQRYNDQPQDPEARADWVSLLSSIDFEPNTLSTLLAAPWLEVGAAAEVDQQP